MQRTFKYRIFPTKSQKTGLNQTLESCRWVYNKCLETRKYAWEQDKKSISQYDTFNMIPEWRIENPKIKEAYVQVLRDSCTRVDLAFQAFFRRCKKGEKPGYPRFKSFGRYDSFTFTQGGFKIDKKLHLGKIGDIKIKLHRPLEGKIKTLTIQKDKIGNWYACFSCGVEPKILPESSKVVGIDLGLSTFATFSDGQIIARNRWLKQDEKDIKRLQRKLSKTKKSSPERKKVIKALNHAWQRVTNRRSNFAHQESRKLVNEYQIMVFEKLDIQSMQSNGNHRINQGIADVAWSQFINFTSYKAEEAGRTVIKVDPRNTSQECSNCHSIVKKDLSVRVHDCPVCGLKINRDLNASINILGRGLASIQLC